ncbi:MAG: DUF433 domain-containing protein [Symploca sp. SIO2C1]|nr:DUF433 domain-containing protein [Symploca sp. SIO2C1]
MTTRFHRQPTIIRTERGLTIAGTRITLYDVMDYLRAQYPHKFICALFRLTDEQINAVLVYIEANRAEVEAEYRLVLEEAKELQHYWRDQNRELIEKIAKMPPPPGKEVAWEKLQAHKAKLQARLASKA